MADGTIHLGAQAADDRVGGGSAPTMNKRQLAKAATRQKVLDAGKALFEAVGYEAATIRAIAARAGMSTGAVFANFKDKRDLYVAVYGHPPLSPEQGLRLFRAATGRAGVLVDGKAARTDAEQICNDVDAAVLELWREWGRA